MNNKQVLLVVPPCSIIWFPAIGPSLLVSKCKKNGITSAVLYKNIEFANQIGFERYQELSLNISFLGEAIFRPWVFLENSNKLNEKSIEDHLDFLEKKFLLNEKEYTDYGVVKNKNKINRKDIEICISQVPSFIKESANKIIALQPKIVGFSSVFYQTFSSIAIAKEIKAIAPEIITVFGGANASSPMGKAISDISNKAFDFIFSGESDNEFPSFCDRFINNNELPSSQVIECKPVFDMDNVETPCYDDYFDQINNYTCNPTVKDMPYWLHFETSRGCWWGHCNFCGLNSTEKRYRYKSKKRIIREILYLSKKYKIKKMHAVDNIMSNEFKNEILPILAKSKTKPELFFEVKSNLSEKDLNLFVKANITSIQPGIESFSSNILRLIRKGVTGIQNIRLLRDCISRKIYVSWNILINIPGSKKEDYERMINIFPLIEHFEPPEGCGSVRFDRYSNYYKSPESYNIKKIHPYPSYHNIYPKNIDISNIAYHFIGDENLTLFPGCEKFFNKFKKAVEEWILNYKNNKPVLRIIPLWDNNFLIEDTRKCSFNRYFAPNNDQITLLKILQHPTRREEIKKNLLKQIEILMEKKFIILYEKYYLSIITDPSIGIKQRQVI